MSTHFDKLVVFIFDHKSVHVTVNIHCVYPLTFDIGVFVGCVVILQLGGVTSTHTALYDILSFNLILSHGFLDSVQRRHLPLLHHAPHVIVGNVISPQSVAVRHISQLKAVLPIALTDVASLVKLTVTFLPLTA